MTSPRRITSTSPGTNIGASSPILTPSSYAFLPLKHPLLPSGTSFASWSFMETPRPPRDSDPSEMTDFEKNATLEELEQIAPEPDSNRDRQERGRQERGNRGPDEEPGFGQGA
jgi:hypothetical protein